MFDPHAYRGPDLASGMAPGAVFWPANQGPDGGPLANIQDQVAAVLNADGNGPRVYIAAGDSEPIFQAPNPQRWQMQQRGYQPQAQASSGPAREVTPAEVERATRLLAYAILLAVFAVLGFGLTGSAAVAAIAGIGIVAVVAIARRVRPSGRAAR
jgi:hypothetical protein